MRKNWLKRNWVTPPRARLKKGPVVVVECVEEIPCDPCADACPRGAISVVGGLTAIPKVDFERCNGCGLCVARCPGLAIFVVNWAYSEKEATVTLPYELLPRPEVGEKVIGLDRSGKRVCTARVIKVLNKEVQDRCTVVTVSVPKVLWNDVRAIMVKG